MPNNVSISITADVADLVAKRAILSSELRAASSDLNAFAKTARTGGMTNELRAGMLSAAESVTKARSQISGLDKDLKALGGNSGFSAFFGNLGGGATRAIEGAAGQVPILGGALAGLGPEALAAAAGIAAMVTALHEASKAADWAEDLERFAKATGQTTTAVQEFDFIAQATGIPVASMRSSLQGLAEVIGRVQDNLVRGKQGAQVKLFELVFGVDDPEKAKQDLRDLGGNLDAILPKILDLSARLTPLGRAGLAQALHVDPQVLNELTEARTNLANLREEAHRYGIIVDEDVIKRSAAAAEQMHVTKTVIDDELRQAFLNLAPGAAAAAGGLLNITNGIAHLIDFAKQAIAPLVGLLDLMDKIPGVGPGGGRDIFSHLMIGSFAGPRQAPGSSQMADAMRSSASVFGKKSDTDAQLEKLIEGLGKTGGKGGRGARARVSDELAKQFDAEQEENKKLAEMQQRIGESDATTGLDVQKSGIGDRRAQVEALYRDEVISAQEKKARLDDLAREEAANEIALQEQKKALYASDVVAVREAANQELVIRANLKAQLDALERQLTEDKKREEEKRVEAAKQAAEKTRQQWHSIVDPMVSTTGSQIKGLIEGTETWGQALRNIGEEALTVVIDAIERMVEQWLINMIVGQTATKTTAVSQVASYAGVAGAAGVASFAGAPWPIDMGAPAFGAAMAADAGAYATLASLDVGTNVVPADMIAQVHAGERVIPAADNRQLIAAVSGGANGVRGGDFHGDFSTTIHGGGSLSGRDVVKALEGAQGHFSRLLKGMHRNGHFAFAR